MQQPGPIVWLVAGLVVGWLSGALMRGNGYGRIGDAAIGALGALVGVWVFGFLVTDPQRNELIGSILFGLGGAAIFVTTARVLTRRSAPAPAA